MRLFYSLGEFCKSNFIMSTKICNKNVKQKKIFDDKWSRQAVRVKTMKSTDKILLNFPSNMKVEELLMGAP